MPVDQTTATNRPVFLTSPAHREPGVNVDAINVDAGLERLTQLGWDRQRDQRTFTVIEYALQRWARGEEAAAEKGAIDATFYGIDLTSWRIVLASAMAGAQETATQQPQAEAQAASSRQQCFACGHIHAEGPGACWEAACAPQCCTGEDCPLPYSPDDPAVR